MRTAGQRRARRYDAVLFDLDGTLADTLDDIADAVNHALALHGLPIHSREGYRHLVGEGVHRLVERALPPGHEDRREAVYEAVRDHYLAHMLDRTVPYAGIPELLDALEERALAMAVLSNKPAPATDRVVDALFGRHRFACVVGQVDEIPHKPDPWSAFDIARRIGVPPERFLYLGDTSTDMETAVAAGMYPVGALWGFRDRDELAAHGARSLIERPLDLLTLI